MKTSRIPTTNWPEIVESRQEQFSFVKFATRVALVVAMEVLLSLPAINNSAETIITTVMVNMFRLSATV